VAAARLAFAPGGILFMTMGGAFGVEREDGTVSFGGQGKLAQDPASHAGKLLRLRDDGSVPPDNPFVGREGYKPEIYSMGHRNQQGLTLHPETGLPWATEHAPQGGDELNAILPGRNYGWPVVSYGRHSMDRASRAASGRRGWGSPWCAGCRRSRRRASPSTPATASRSGRATSSRARS
jgi:glucose/arabinose dehydrogenase